MDVFNRYMELERESKREAKHKSIDKGLTRMSR